LNLKNEGVAKACEEIYNNLINNSYEVLFDDRLDAQAGVKFNDADLLGMPLQIIVGDKKLKTNQVEVKIRKTGERFDVELASPAGGLNKLIGKIKEIWSETVLK